MRTGKRLMLRAAVMMLPLLIWAGGALAAWSLTNELGFTWKAGEREIDIPLTANYKEEIGLYLPGSCDGTLTVRASADDMTWNGKHLTNGEVLDISGDIGTTVAVTVRDGAKTIPVKVMRGSAIPNLFFEFTEDDWSRIHKRKGLDIKQEVRLVMLDARGREEISDTVTSFHMRGNSTVFGYKHPYQFKLAHSASLEGMGKGKTWLLLANFFDISLIRNQITYDLCREIGLTSTPDCCQADLFVNGSYYGTYLLSEKIQLRKGRVDITNMEDKLRELNGGEEAMDQLKQKTSKSKTARFIRYFDVEEPEDITGGFLLEIEKALQFSLNETEAGFSTENQMCVVIKEPSQPGKEAVEYIAGIVNDMHNAALEKDGISDKTGTYYADYIDMESFAAKIAVEEFSCNYDVRAASQYMYKDSDRVDSKIYAGPGWDYDLSYGNKEDGQKNPLKLDYVYGRSSSKVYLYHALLSHEDFQKATRKVFEEKVLPAAEILLGRREAPEGSQVKSLAEYRADIAASADMNFTRWTTHVGNKIMASAGRTFDEAQDYLLNWITQRTDMLKEQWLTEVK